MKSRESTPHARAAQRSGSSTTFTIVSPIGIQTESVVGSYQPGSVAEPDCVAYDTYDVELFMAVTAADFQFVDERGTADQATQASYFPALREGGQKGEIIGDPAIVSEDPFVVAVDARITADWYPAEGRVGTSTYTLVVENGELKVQEHRWTGDLL